MTTAFHDSERAVRPCTWPFAELCDFAEFHGWEVRLAYYPRSEALVIELHAEDKVFTLAMEDRTLPIDQYAAGMLVALRRPPSLA